MKRLALLLLLASSLSSAQLQKTSVPGGIRMWPSPDLGRIAYVCDGTTGSFCTSAALEFSGTQLHVETSINLANSTELGSTTFQYGNSVFGVSQPELEISNNNPGSGGFLWNVASFRALSTDQYSAITFRQVDGRERGAIGFGNSATASSAFTGNTYIESSYFPMSGTNKPAGLMFAQTGYMNGSNGTYPRLYFDNTSLIHFYRLNGNALLSLDTANGYLAFGTAGAFNVTTSGLTYDVLQPGALEIKQTADHAGIRLDANGSGKVPFVDFYFNAVKKGNIYWDNANSYLTINDQSTETCLGCGGGNVKVNVLTASKPVFSDASKRLSSTGTVPADSGGTGLNGGAAGNGKLLIGNGSGFSLNNLTAGTNITITNSSGGIQIDSTGGSVGGTAGDPALFHARLTLTSGTPVTTSDVTAATTLYLTPFQGGHIALYYSSAWTVYSATEHSLKLSDTQTCTTTNTSTSVTGCTDTSQLMRGMKVSGTGVSGGQTISAITSSTAFTLSAAATASGSVSLSFKVPASTNVDVFAVPTSSSVYRLQGTAWTNGTTRATAVTYASAVDGVLVNDAAIATGDSNAIAASAGRYVGTVRTTTTDGETEDSGTGSQTGSAKRFVWNYYNRVRTPTFRFESTATWTYVNPAGVTRQVNSSTNNQLEIVVGQAEDAIDLEENCNVTSNTVNKYVWCGIGRNSTTAVSANARNQTFHTPTTGLFFGNSSRLVEVPPVGYSYYAWLEGGENSTFTLTFNGTSGGDAKRAGIIGVVER